MKRPWFALSVLIALVPLTGAKWVWNTFHDSEDDPSEVFTSSAAEARRDGILISGLDVEFVPGPGPNLAIAEAWIEQCAVHRYSYVWFHRRVPSGGVTVIIKLKEPADPHVSLWPPAREASFGWIGGDYFVRHFKQMPAFPMAVDRGEARGYAPLLTLRRPAGVAGKPVR